MKINIRLFLNRSKPNRIGKCPLICRITYNKARKEFSTRQFIYPKYWNRRKQKVIEDTEHSEYTNTQLSLIINKMNQAFILLQVKESIFTSCIKVRKFKKNTILYQKCYYNYWILLCSSFDPEARLLNFFSPLFPKLIFRLSERIPPSSLYLDP